MFKKKCSKCNNKISKNYDFCPFCGNNLINLKSRKDYGFLGKNDIIEDNPFSLFEESFMDKLMKNAMKMAEKMIEKQIDFKPPAPPKNPHPTSNMEIQFFVNGKRIFPNEEKIERKPIKLELTKEKAERFCRLPKKEPNSTVRRFSGKVIYEIELPGVKKLDDVLINQLENSIEIKAMGKDQVYSKTLNINLPILGYKLEQGNLILELQAR